MREFNKVLDPDEKVLWEGTPNFLPFFFGGSLLPALVGLFFFLFLIPFIAYALYDIVFGTHLIGFGIFLLPHFWVAVAGAFGVPIYQLLVHKHTHYAVTDKRVLLQKGLIGRDFELVDFDQITNAEVNVGVLDKVFGGNSGSILVSTAGSFTYTRRGAVSKPYTLRNIPNPYEVFKFFKKVSHDVRTDIEYPNKLRPKVNLGYRVNYKGDGPPSK